MKHHWKNLHLEFHKPVGSFHLLDPNLKLDTNTLTITKSAVFSSIKERYDDDDFNDYNEGFSGYNDVDDGVRIGVLIDRFLRYSCIFKMDSVQFYHHYD